jgi:hypothetical protein
MVRTVVSSGNDALNLLFEAAAYGQQDNNSQETNLQQRGTPTTQRPRPTRSTGALGTSPAAPAPVEISDSTEEVIHIWEACRFVKMGWFTAREAITFVDLFFKNMSPLSPILTNFYSQHRTHLWLVTHEPVLFCTILMISSRYHVLPGGGGASRSFFIHHRLWQHCQSLIMRVILGQEKSAKCKTRTVGTIEALLLMSEWHPRSLHFPPENDGWDSDLVTSTSSIGERAIADTVSSSSNRWLEDVVEPARRSDRMSWMLLGSALTLAHELGIFDTEDRNNGDTPDTESGILTEYNQLRRQRIQRLLYVYISQLASRIGCMSLMPQSLNHTIAGRLRTPTSDSSGDGWSTFMESWMDLTKLAKSVNDMFIPSASFAKQQLHSGRYIGLLDHFRPLLKQWREKHLESRALGKAFYNILFIEYHYVRAYTHSFGMQAVVERALADVGPDNAVEDLRPATIDPIDYEFIQEVIHGCCQVLEKITELAETDTLRFSPVRIFFRATSSSIFLLKALSLGVRHAKLQESLDVLDRSIQAMRSNILDDVHLASRYATLLEVQVSRIRCNFAACTKSSGMSNGTTRPSSTAPQLPSKNNDLLGKQNNTGLQELSEVSFSPSLGTSAADDWLSLPLDPSMAPFGTNGRQFSGVEDGTLDFIWNLPL